MSSLEHESHLTSSIDTCRLIDLPRLGDDTDGSLTVVENVGTSPLQIKRVYYLYDVPADAERGGHSHHNLRQLIVALSGSFDVTVDDGLHTKTVTLNRPYKALSIERGIWRTIENFSSGAVCRAGFRKIRRSRLCALLRGFSETHRTQALKILTYGNLAPRNLL